MSLAAQLLIKMVGVARRQLRDTLDAQFVQIGFDTTADAYQIP